jgi:hypothetical protein
MFTEVAFWLDHVKVAVCPALIVAGEAVNCMVGDGVEAVETVIFAVLENGFPFDCQPFTTKVWAPGAIVSEVSMLFVELE